jgi:acetyltransferase-like isoleucine patch superfamily enzyme
MSTRPQRRPGKLIAFLRSPLSEKIYYLRSLGYRLKSALYYRYVFASFGSGSVIYKPMLIGNPRFIHIGNNVIIRDGVRLQAVISDSANPPELRIGDNVNIEQNVHIICHSRIIIGKDVSITGNCAIVDVTHSYENVHDPIKIGSRISPDFASVEIGNRSFLGFGAIVLPNVRIGTYCVVGAQSLVTKDIPDYSVVAGSPARILRSYDPVLGKWVAASSSKEPSSIKRDSFYDS